MYFRYMMFVFRNKFYIIFISIWIIGLYFVLTTFHFTSNNADTPEERIKYLQNEVESLQQKILRIQSGNNEPVPASSQCDELKNELKRVKRQFKEKNGSSKITPQRM